MVDWEHVATVPDTPPGQVIGAVVVDGVLYLEASWYSGGYLRNMLTYDIATGTWSTFAPFPGSIGDSPTFVPVDSTSFLRFSTYGPGVWVYLIDIDTWAELTGWTGTANFSQYAYDEVNGKIYAARFSYGLTPDNGWASVSVYDINTDSWDDTAIPRMVAPCGFAHGVFSLVWPARGGFPKLVWANGWWNDPGMPGGETVVLDLGDVEAGWSFVTPDPHPRENQGPAISGMSALFAVAGLDGFADLVATVNCYDPFADTWTDLPDLPIAVGLPCIFHDADYLYVVGGYSDTGTTCELYRYPWSTLPPSEVLRYGLVMVRGRYLNQDDSTPAQGSLTFTLAQPVRVIDAITPYLVVPYSTKVDLDGAGAFSLTLMAVAVDATNPDGSSYEVQEMIDGRMRSYSVTLTPGEDFDMADPTAP